MTPGPLESTGWRARPVVFESVRYVVLVKLDELEPDGYARSCEGLVFTPDEAKILAGQLTEAAS
jgi:hypothetical protein